jgi:uncharacterized protein
MAEAKTAIANKPAWIDLSTSDPAAAREFYTKVLGWQIEVNPDPQYGGYGMARIDGKDVAGMGPKMDQNAPTAWSLYIGTDDIDLLSGKVEAAGGKVIAPAFDVGPQGKMAVFQDPSGAFISAWQPAMMAGFAHSGANTFAWGELNARGVDKALAFYQTVFGWTHSATPMGEGMGDYHQFQHDGKSIAGAMETPPMVPAEVPSYWLIYFGVADVEASFKKAIDAGGRELVSPSDFPGGRYAVLTDPQGAAFGLMSMAS